MFEGFASQVDWPASYFWKELSAYYPDAKVILTDRDPEAWYESIRHTILPASEIGRHEDPDPVNRKASEMMYQIALEKIFKGRLGERNFAIKKMRAHRQEVIDTIPPERLLVFNITEGWGPLCTFLGVGTPAAPFPRGNSVEEFRERKPYLAKLRVDS
ncbi:MAG: sulfotransferase family protein [Paracoccaceae bacterium]